MAVTTTQRSVLYSATERPTAWFRGDVDGLRAVAIVLVVAYHAGLPFMGAGFIGVDMFFVISGYLISRNLLKEAETSGGVSLATFWARRIRRLVPALALMVVATLVGSYYLLPGYELDPVGKQGGAAALYVSNIYFAREANDYFGSDVAASPFLHTWSLGVEEQFYLLWPVLVAGGYWITRNMMRRKPGGVRRSSVISLFALCFVASIALNVALTRAGSPWAFYGLPARAWEFAAAGLLAAVAVPRALRRPAARTALAVGGLLLLLAAGVLIGETTPYPGLWALLPVLATALIITAGAEPDGTSNIGPISRLLSLAPLQWLGRVSYSWYLWHWPAIVLFVAWRADDSTETKTIAAIAALPVGWLAYQFFETPLRFNPRLTRSVGRTYAFGAATTVLVVMLAVAIRPAEPNASAVATAATLDEAVAALEAPPGASVGERIDLATALYRQRSDKGCPGVGAHETEDGDHYCIGGDPEGDRTVLLLGDSHAGQWRQPLDAIALQRGIRLLIRQGNGCPPYEVSVTSEDRGNDVTILCAGHAEGNFRVIEALDPDAVIIASWSGDRADFIDDSGNHLDESQHGAVWEEGAEALLTSILDSGARVGFILDEPTLPVHAGQCLSRENDIQACETPIADALTISGPILEAERRVLDRLGDVPTIDVTDLVCDDERCRLEIDGTLTYLDTHHLTDAFAMRQRPLLEDMLTDLLSER